MTDHPETPPDSNEAPRFSVGRLVVSLGLGMLIGLFCWGLCSLFSDSQDPLQGDPQTLGTTVGVLVTAAALWVGATGDNLRRAIRIGMACFVVVGFTADGCGAPLWGSLLLGIVFAVIGFMLEKKKDEVGDFSDFLDD